MLDKYEKIVLALSGIFQAALLVKKIAETGNADESAVFATINSLYQIDAPDVPSIYGNINSLKYGLLELEKFCNRSESYKSVDITRYAFSLMYLERKLKSDSSRKTTLSRRMTQAISQAKYFSSTHPTVISSLASIYIDIFGTINFKIKVLGRANLLTRTDIADKVRALLLAGIRSAVLWRQVGGNRLQLIFSRNKIQLIAKEFLKNINSTEIPVQHNGIR